MERAFKAPGHGGTADKKRADPLRIGLLGGTFDPVHLWHLRTALEVAEGLTLECVYLVPASVPPHKERGAVASFADRIAMVRMAIQGTQLLGALDVEGRREGFSYTVQTLQELRDLYPDDLELFFILGMDSFLEVTTWKRYEDLFSLCNFVVLRRPGSERKNPEDLTPQRYWAAFHPDKDGNRWIHTPSGLSVYFLNNPLIDISSSEIRERIQTGRSVRYMMQEKVAAYIHEHGLYGRT